LRVVRTVQEVRAEVGGWRSSGFSVGSVPTMGALHEGHLSLVRRARAECDRVVATLFVNPLQFGPDDDFDRYPRDEPGDIAKLTGEGCDLLFAPDVAEMFPDGPESAGFLTRVTVLRLSEQLCGRSRPTHFAGMITETLKLLLITLADRTYWGEKDYQQLRVVGRAVRDLNVPVTVVGVPTVREADGLAMSSRNGYLDVEQRRVAPALYRTITTLADRLSADPHLDAAAEAKHAAVDLLDRGFDSVDYLEVVDAQTLLPLSRVEREARVLVAAQLGRARLIDNVACLPKGGTA
jgi:pantoate--beta-alanine ligase